MVPYIVGRLMQAVVSIFVVITAVFFVVRLTGDPVDVYVPDFAPAEFVLLVKERLGLDKPLYEQYLIYISSLVRLDLGNSINGTPVVEVLASRLPNTLTLAGLALAMTLVVAVPLGVISAVRRGSVLDTFARLLALLGQSVPSFWLAIMLILVFAVVLRWLPVAHQPGIESYILPAIAIALAPVAGLVRLIRSSMLETLQGDHVRMARAKGLSPWSVYMKHALRNSLIPVVTYAGLMLAAFLNGSVIVENVFAWPGIGTMTLDAVTSRDFPLVQGAVLLAATTLILLNLLVDLLYVLIDPRIRYG